MMKNIKMVLREAIVIDYIYLDGGFTDGLCVYELVGKHLNSKHPYEVLFSPQCKGWCLIVISDDKYILPIPLNYKVHITALESLSVTNYNNIPITREFIHKSFQECDEINNTLEGGYTKKEHYKNLLEHLQNIEDYKLCIYLKTQYENELD